MIPKELTRNVAAPSSGHFEGYLNTTIGHDMLQYYQRRLSCSWNQGYT